MRVSEVPVALSSLNKGDVFILDLGLKLILFCGPTSNKVMRWHTLMLDFVVVVAIVGVVDDIVAFIVGCC